MMSQRRLNPTTTVYQPGSGRFLPEGKKQTTQRDPLPEDFGSLEEFRAFRDTHSTADYEDLVEDVDVHINVRSGKVYCTVVKDLLAQLRTHARRQGVSTETLINLWLREKVMKVAQGSAGLFDRQISIVQSRTQIHADIADPLEIGILTCSKLANGLGRRFMFAIFAPLLFCC